MKKRKRLITVCVVAALLLLALAASILYFIYLTPRGYRMTVRMHGYYQILDGVWLDRDFTGDVDKICDDVKRARDRVHTFFGDVTSDPYLIITENEKKLKRLGGEHDITTFAVGEVYSYISIGVDIFDVDVVAHELQHAEMHERLYKGTVTFDRVVPPWFDEGVALQVDYSPRYSWDALLKCTENMTVLPDFERLADEDYFYNSEEDTILYNYIVSKYEVGRWLLENGGEKALLLLIDKINKGADFYSLYDVPMSEYE